jgi:hypothetical protein
MTNTSGTDRHKLPAMLTRPDPELRARLTAKLADRGWTMSDFVIACMELGDRNTDAMLKRLAQFKPSRRMGRPPKT